MRIKIGIQSLVANQKLAGERWSCVVSCSPIAGEFILWKNRNMCPGVLIDAHDIEPLTSDLGQAQLCKPWFPFSSSNPLTDPAFNP